MEIHDVVVAKLKLSTDIQKLLDEEASTEKTPGWKSVSKSDLTEVSRKSTKGDKLHLIKVGTKVIGLVH